MERVQLLLRNTKYSVKSDEILLKDNYTLSVGKAMMILQSINNRDIDQLDSSLGNLRSFLLLKDSLQQARLEWIFGHPMHQYISGEFGWNSQ